MSMLLPGFDDAHAVADGLYGMRGEIGASLARARNDLDQYPGTGTASPPLQAAAGELRSVHGTLATIECFGAGLLAQEMVLLLDALGCGRASGEAACAAVSGASLQLADYVELLAQGADDCAQVLQPTLSELRLARGAAPLSALDLFAHQLRVQPLAEFESARNGDAARAKTFTRTLARRHLPEFQQGFLRWYRGRDAAAAIGSLGGIAARIAETAEAPELRELWSGYAALADGSHADDPVSLDRQRLFGSAASQLKWLAEAGEPAALMRLGEARPQLLFELARIPRPNAHAQELIARLRLDRLLPSSAALATFRARLRGPRPLLLDQLHQETQAQFWYLGEELANPSRRADAASRRLREFAAGLGALAQPASQRALLNHAAALESSASEAESRDIGAAVQRLQRSLEDALFRGLEFTALAAATPLSIALPVELESSEVESSASEIAPEALAVEVEVEQAPTIAEPAIAEPAPVADEEPGASLAIDAAIIEPVASSTLTSTSEFLADSARLLDTLDQHQSAWAYGDSTAITELGQGLQAFAVHTRVAGATEVEQAARGLERELARLDAAAPAPTQWRLAAGLEGLRRLLGNLSRGEMLDAAGLLESIGVSPYAG